MESCMMCDVVRGSSFELFRNTAACTRIVLRHAGSSDSSEAPGEVDVGT